MSQPKKLYALLLAGFAAVLTLGSVCGADKPAAVFEGRDRGPHRGAVLLNAALALEVCGAAPDAVAGMRAAGDAVDRGAAAQLLGKLASFGAASGAATGR